MRTITDIRSQSIVPHQASGCRIVLYSHDTLGFGHLRRNLLLAGALRDSALDPQILMIGGIREAGAFEFPQGVDCLTLPAYAKGSDGVYRPRDLGSDVHSLTRLRGEIIKSAVEHFSPDIMIVDNAPRGALGELSPLLESLRPGNRPRMILGLRDVLDEAEVVRSQWIAQRNFEAVSRHYDDVWIYGDPDFYDVVRECGISEEMEGKARFVGYLNHASRLALPVAMRDRDDVLGQHANQPYIFCSVGGGRDGTELCEAFLSAPLPHGHRGVLVSGTQMAPDLRRRLRTAAGLRPDISFLEFVREPIALMAGASGIISMGGYNTICEVLSLRRPSLIVPRVRPRAEQAIRAGRLADRGLISMLHPDDLDPGALAGWMQSLVGRAEAGVLPIDMNGLEHVRRLVEQAFLAAQPRRMAHA